MIVRTRTEIPASRLGRSPWWIPRRMAGLSTQAWTQYFPILLAELLWIRINMDQASFIQVYACNL
jgi:hypothetical protein